MGWNGLRPPGETRLCATPLPEPCSKSWLRYQTGLLITVDELHTADISEMTRSGALGVGLPQLLTDLISGDVAAFLQCCHRLEVGSLSTTEVKAVLA